MHFIKDLLRNLAFLFVIGILLLLFAPDMIRQVYELFGALFGPLIILAVFAAALPHRRRSKH